jgi:hypothetical protein
MLPVQLKTHVKCVPVNMYNKSMICIINNEHLILHHKAFRVVYILRTAKILRTQRCANSSTAQILMQVRQ